MLARIWRKGNPSMLLVEMQIGAAMMENNMNVPQKIKIQLPHNPTPFYICKENESINSNR